MTNIVKTKDLPEKNFGAVSIAELFNVPGSPANISVVIVHVQGVNRKQANMVSESFFYVMEGNGVFTIGQEDDQEQKTVEAGDFVHIPKAIAYFESGQMKMLCVNAPAYDAEKINYFAE